MKKITLSFMFISLVLLVGCGGKKNVMQHQQQTAHKSAEIPLADDNPTKVSFFDDQDIGGFEDIESFVLDESDGHDNVKLTNADRSFDIVAEKESSPEKKAQVVYFDYDSSKPRKDQEDGLKSIKESVNKWAKQGCQVVFKGHSCLWHGTRAYNLALSGQRAQTLADSCGIPQDNVKVFGVGNEEPVVCENSKEAQAPNRRVEVYPIVT